MRLRRLVGCRGKPDDPRRAVEDAIAEHEPDRVLVVVRRGDEATWLEEDQVERIPREVSGVPVRVVVL